MSCLGQQQTQTQAQAQAQHRCEGPLSGKTCGKCPRHVLKKSSLGYVGQYNFDYKPKNAALPSGRAASLLGFKLEP